MPKLIAAVVMMIGRNRTRASSALRQPVGAASRTFVTKSISWMPFLVTSPINMMLPIIDIRLMVPLVNHNAKATPKNDSGSDNMIESPRVFRRARYGSAPAVS
jgi:hypothetical protein